jgi:cobalt-zinc-cadmium efflux system membrane fusion protein
MKRFIVKPTLGLILFALLAPAWADEGHAHDEPAPALNGNGPQRLPDGSLFLPKPTQHQLGVRTQQLLLADLPRSHELAGTVVMDPNAGGKVQALIGGRLEAGPDGFPSIGQAVRKGQVLAHVIPSLAAGERMAQAAQLAERRAARQLADARLTRLRALSDTVPRKDIEHAASEAASLAAQVAALAAGSTARDTLLAPVSGVIASSHAVAGQVVEARELLFEVIDPTRLQLEVLSYDPALASDVAGATLAIGRARVPLTFIGAARSLREQALPMLFKGQGPALSQLAVGQPVQVFVHSASHVRGLALPAASLMRNAANQSIVWVKVEAERFAPRSVTFLPLDGVQVAVTSGLHPGDRVVTQGATLINQIR